MQIGGTFEISISDAFAIETGMQYALKGYKFTLRDQLYKVNLHYLEMPITAKYYFVNIGRNSRLFGTGGFYFGGLLSAKSNGEKLNIGSIPKQDFYKFLDIGYSLGIGILIHDRFEISTFVRNGLANVDTYDINTKERTMTSGISVGYKF